MIALRMRDVYRLLAIHHWHPSERRWEAVAVPTKAARSPTGRSRPSPPRAWPGCAASRLDYTGQIESMRDLAVREGIMPTVAARQNRTPKP
jgi:predicted nucleic acid-binding Zn ribbon protein